VSQRVSVSSFLGRPIGRPFYRLFTVKDEKLNLLLKFTDD